MNKIALVTGYSSSLGKMIADTLAGSGYEVYAGIRSSPKASLPDSAVIPLDLDITSDAGCRQAVETVIRRSGRLDLIVNVAGLTLTGPFWSHTSADFLSILDINVVGAFRLISAALPHLRHRTGALVVNIASLNSFLASPNYALYSASKYALFGFGSAAALELFPAGIHLVSLAPGALQSTQSSPHLPAGHKPARQALPLLGWLLPLTPPRAVAEKIIQLTNQRNPPPLVLVGRDSFLMYYLQKFLPGWLWFRIQTWLWQKQN